MKHRQGNAMAEYGIIAALIACGVIGSVKLLGLGLSNSWGDFAGALRKNSDARQTQVAQSGDKMGKALPDAAALTSSKYQGALNSALLEQTMESIQVAGANGTTKELLRALENRIKALEDSGEITEEDANQLHKLANAGHYLANAEKLLEDAYSAGKDTITFEGKTYSLQDFATKVIGFNHVLSVKDSWDTQPSGMNPAMKPFAEAYSDLRNSDAFLNPVVKQEIFALTQQIAAVDDALSWATEKIMIKGYPPSEWSQHQDEFTQSILTGFKENTLGEQIVAESDSASEMNHGNSTKICSTGGGKDNGKKCSD